MRTLSASFRKVPFRVLSFAVVLVFVGLLLATLFSEARAASFEYVSPVPTTVSGPATFTVDLVLPSGQVTPIQSIDAVVERQGDGQTSKRAPVVVTRARCPMAIFIECSSTGNTPVITVQGLPGVISKIRNVGAFRASAPTVPMNTGYFGAGTVTITRTGYGYDTVSPDVLAGGPGYGYGYRNGNVGAVADPGFTQGYGYLAGGVDDLILRFAIDVDASVLVQARTHYLTVLAVTGSAVIGEISSPFTEFVTSARPGGGGAGAVAGGGGGGPAPGPGPAPSQGTAEAQQSSTPSPGASATYTASFSSTTGVSQLSVNFPDAAPLDNLVLSFDAMATSVQVTVDIFTTAPPGVTVPGGANPVQFFVITVQSGTSRVASAEFQLDVATNTIQNVLRRQLVLVHYRAGQDQDVIKLIQLPDTPGEAHFQARTTGLSPFALLADVQSPTVTLSVPSGTLSGIQRLAVTAADNLKIDRIQIIVDGVLQQTITGASGSYDWDTSSVADGTHSVEAKAFDVADNEISQSASVFTANQATPSPTPPPKPPTRFPLGPILIVLIIVIAIIAVAVLVVRKRKGPKPPSGGGGTPPEGPSGPGGPP